jgi:NTE family protein
LLVQQRLLLDVAAHHDQVDLIALPPPCPLTITPVDFAHADALIDRARTESGDWLDKGGHLRPHPEQFLSLHDHLDLPNITAGHPEDTA